MGFPAILRRASGQRRGKSPVKASNISDGAGPIPTQVTVPGSTCVRPRSLTTNTGNPLALALLSSSDMASNSRTLRATLHWPSFSQPFHQLGDRIRASSAAETAAWEHWTAIFPRPIAKSNRTTRACLNLKPSDILMVVECSHTI